MGIERFQGPRVSLKRISHTLDEVKRKVVKAATGVQHKNATARPSSVVSDIQESRGVLCESNALNDQGAAIVCHVAEMIQERVEQEDRVNTVDPFSKGSVPPVPLVDYFGRLSRYINVWRGHAGGAESAGVRAAVLAYIYLVNLEEIAPEYAINRTNVHRLAMAAFLVATKFTEDYVISLDFYSKVAGISIHECSKLETAFCSLTKFKLYVEEEEYQQTLDGFF